MKHVILFFLSITLVACGANINIHKSIPHEVITDKEKGGYSHINIGVGEIEASSGFIGALAKNLQQYLAELSLYPKKDGSLRVHVQIIGYKIKQESSRAVMGTLAGADEVTSKIQVINTDTDEVIGESTVLTSSSMAYGAKAMAWVHADDIATFLSTTN